MKPLTFQYKGLSTLIDRIVTTQRNNSYSSRSREVAGTRTADIEITIDVDQLVRDYYERALRSQGRKAKLSNGSICVRVVKATERDDIIPHVHTDTCKGRDGSIACDHQAKETK